MQSIDQKMSMSVQQIIMHNQMLFNEQYHCYLSFQTHCKAYTVVVTYDVLV